MRILVRSLAAAILILAALPAVLWAQQQALPNVVRLDSEEAPVRRYAVEFIVFEYAGSAANTTEIFAPEPIPELPLPGQVGADPDAGPLVFSDRPLAAGAGESLPGAIDSAENIALAGERNEEQGSEAHAPESLQEIPTFEGAGIEMIDPADYQLIDVYEKLVRLDAYRPLMHSGWIQPTVENAVTRPLPLRRLGNPPLRLNGELTLYLSRFLHLVVDLSLEQAPSTGTMPAAARSRFEVDDRPGASRGLRSAFSAPPTIYRIDEDRIVRHDEVRYYDHPKFGVIARVTRIEEPLPEGPDTTSDLLPGSPPR